MENIKIELLNHSHLNGLIILHEKVFNIKVDKTYFKIKYGLEMDVKVYSHVALESEKVIGFIGAIEQQYHSKSERFKLVHTGDYFLEKKYRGTQLFDEMYTELERFCLKEKVDLILAFNSEQTYKVSKRWGWNDMGELSRFHFSGSSKYFAKFIQLLGMAHQRNRRFIDRMGSFEIEANELNQVRLEDEFRSNYSSQLIRMKSNYNKVFVRIENCLMIIKYDSALTVAYLELNSCSNLKEACAYLQQTAKICGFTEVIFHLEKESLEAIQLRTLIEGKESFKITGKVLNKNMDVNKLKLNLFEMDII